jgi:2-polyprenyl-6-methoxyphenol hydroxylase-like FAD-dependent oxidoreductase
MTNSSVSDVLIVGAGPVGLTLACDLARRGVALRIIDRSPAYPVGTRARGVRSRTQEVFEDLGVLAAISARAEPQVPTRFYDRQGQIARETALYDAPAVPGRRIRAASSSVSNTPRRSCATSCNHVASPSSWTPR